MLADLSPWLAVFGRAHPLLLHAPFGLLPAMAMFEFGPLLLRRTPLPGVVQALAVLTGLSGALAMASGLVLGGEQDGGGELLSQHKTAGIVLGALCLWLLILSFRPGRLPLRLTLLGALVAMVPVGHLGGSLTHGKDFLFAPLQPAKDQPSSPLGTTLPPAQQPSTSDRAPVTSPFAALAQPMLERVCVQCHNPDKLKGELLLTTAEGVQKGGETGPVVVAGRPDESPLLQRCLLPLDDEDHMPPEGKKQPTAAELDLLRQWIAGGAKFQ
ncbi:MAG: hypothetical protein JNL12_10510 [Planctomycetes bacterium]|nr:hypothetical protein [Planctomycetota bacterium]